MGRPKSNIVRPLCIHCKVRPVKRVEQWLCSRSCANAYRGRSIAERFLKFYKPGPPDKCWQWTGTIHHRGYGVIGDNKNRQYLAHRLAYEHANGPIPEGLYVCHTCDNPPCCNPAHLFVGTDADNQADKARKGRSTHGAKSRSAKLTESDVRIIRSLYPGMSQQAIADRFHVNQTIVSDIVRRVTWKRL
jgi:hypothetical protein